MTSIDKDIFEDAKLWDFPSVDDKQAELDAGTNALNRPRGKWQYEAPDEEPEVSPLTAEDIEAIRASAYEEGLEGGKEEGFKQGYEEGLEKGTIQGVEEGKTTGFESGQAEAQIQTDALNDKFSAIISQLQSPLALANSELQKELVILATALAKSVIKVESQHNQDVLISAIDEGIKALPILESQYHIMLNPEDVEWLTAHFGSAYISEQNWHFIAAPELAQGGCKVQTINNAVDVSIEKRCDQIFTQLLFDQGVADDPRAK